MFELKRRDGLARICELSTRHGTVTTPTLLPVINPNINLIPAGEMKRKFGTQMVITNSYIIHKDGELREKALRSGIHSLLDTEMPVMSDSGTFQSYVYGSVEVEPREIVEFQRDSGVDVGTILDVFSTPDRKHDEAEKDVAETLRRAELSTAVKGDMALAGTVQGSVYPDLRKHCAEGMSRLPLDLHPIGGVVPLMESGRYAELTEIIIAAKSGLTHARPVHLFGAGHPLYLPVAALLGCDLFDSASYAKYARDGRMMFPGGTRKIATMSESPCCCPVCSDTPLKELRSLEEGQRTGLLAEHNLHVLFSELRAIREAIFHGSLWDVVEGRCLSHPGMKPVLAVLKRHREFLERYDPLSRDAAFTPTGTHSFERPLVRRFRQRVLRRYEMPPSRVLVALPDGERPYSARHSGRISKIRALSPDACFVITSAMGPVPLELDEAYPVAQSIFYDEPDRDHQSAVNQWMKEFSHGLDGRLAVVWTEDVPGDLATLFPRGERIPGADDDLRRVRAVVDFQFGRGVAGLLFADHWTRSDALAAGMNIEIVKSRKTGKIRNVLLDGDHLLSMRAHDGLFTLKLHGARLIHAGRTAPFMRVAVEQDSVEFNRQGKNVFAGFVLEADEDLRPGDECLVTDARDNLVAVGRTLLTSDEIADFQKGVAVRIREGNPEGSDL